MAESRSEDVSDRQIEAMAEVAPCNDLGDAETDNAPAGSFTQSVAHTKSYNVSLDSFGGKSKSQQDGEERQQPVAASEAQPEAKPQPTPAVNADDADVAKSMADLALRPRFKGEEALSNPADQTTAAVEPSSSPDRPRARPSAAAMGMVTKPDPARDDGLVAAASAAALAAALSSAKLAAAAAARPPPPPGVSTPSPRPSPRKTPRSDGGSGRGVVVVVAAAAAAAAASPTSPTRNPITIASSNRSARSPRTAAEPATPVVRGGRPELGGGRSPMDSAAAAATAAAPSSASAAAAPAGDELLISHSKLLVDRELLAVEVRRLASQVQHLTVQQGMLQGELQRLLSQNSNLNSALASSVTTCESQAELMDILSEAVRHTVLVDEHEVAAAAADVGGKSPAPETAAGEVAAAAPTVVAMAPAVVVVAAAADGAE